VTSEILHHRGTTVVRRVRLEPREALPWHRDPHHRVTVVLAGDELAIEFQDGGKTFKVPVEPGQVDWDEPSDRVHRAVNTGPGTYEEVTVFFLDDPHAEPQPPAG